MFISFAQRPYAFICSIKKTRPKKKLTTEKKQKTGSKCEYEETNETPWVKMCTKKNAKYYRTKKTLMNNHIL